MFIWLSVREPDKPIKKSSRAMDKNRVWRNVGYRIVFQTKSLKKAFA
jgi:hypothetical protein